MADEVTRWDKYLTPNEQDLEEQTRWDKHIQPKGMPLTAMVGERFVDTFLATPSMLGELATMGGAAFGGPAAFGMRDENPLANIPKPQITEIAAGVRSLPAIGPGGESFTESFGREMAETDAARLVTEREHPVRSAIAPMAGDALALLTGRLPFLNRISKFEDLLMTVNKPDLFFSTSQVAKAPVTVRKAVSDALFQNPKIRKMGRGLFRAGEASIENTALNLINNNDPGENLGYVAGLQLANSGLLQAGQSIFSGSGTAKATKLTAALFVGAALWQQVQIGTPIDDNFLDALNLSAEKIFLGLALGTAAGMVGGGRLRGSTDEMSRTAQTILDSLTTVSRGSVMGLIREMAEASPEEQQAMSMLMNGALMNPGALRETEQTRINSAIENNTLAATATVLMRDREFVERLMSEPEEQFQPDFSKLSGIPFEK